PCRPLVHVGLLKQDERRFFYNLVRHTQRFSSMDEEIRLSLWEAFSDFFLDTEITDVSFRHAASIVERSGISLAEAEAVLWNEVFPVLYVNLESVAGVWAGWPQEWLKANLHPSVGPARRTGPQFAVQAVQRCWEQTLGYLVPHA
ncbi:hypothetical protein RHOFW104R3_18650, partial [Rhodanobacter denitrificans]